MKQKPVIKSHANDEMKQNKLYLRIIKLNEK